MKLLIVTLLGFIAFTGYMMSPWHHGYDGYMGRDPHFNMAVVRWHDAKRRTWVKLCLGTLENCRLMHKPGDGHTPRISACPTQTGYQFCAARTIVPPIRRTEAIP